MSLLNMVLEKLFLITLVCAQIILLSYKSCLTLRKHLFVICKKWRFKLFVVSLTIFSLTAHSFSQAVTAKGALVVNASSGKILMQKNAYQSFYRQVREGVDGLSGSQRNFSRSSFYGK